MPGRGRLSLYVAATGVVAATLCVLALRSGPGVQPAMFAAAVLVAEFFPARVRQGMWVSLTSVVLVVAMIVGGVATAVLAALGSAAPLVLSKSRRTDRLQPVFNTAQYVISAGVGGLVLQFGLAATGSSFPQPMTLLVIAAASLAFTLVNFGLVAGAVTLSSPDAFWSTLFSSMPSLPLQVPYAGIAVLAAVLIHSTSPWALALMIVPTVVARYGLLAFQRLDEAYDDLVRGFVTAIEIKDLYTRGHSERVSQLSVLTAEELGLDYSQRRLTRYAALLHDVGKVGVPLCVINKAGPLDDDEFAEMKRHPTIGADILRDIDFLSPAIDIVRYHHERLDGRGYPHGVAADDLPEIVRIVTAVDAFDAMTSTRSYRRALSVEDALAELRRCVGGQFDPQVVAAVATVVERVGWQPTVEFASVAELHGQTIPMVGTAAERLELDAGPIPETRGSAPETG